MGLTILPLAIAAVLDHVLLDASVISDFNDVASRYRNQIGPTQRLQIELREANVAVEAYLDSREPNWPPAYREQRVRSEAAFVGLQRELRADAQLSALLRRAQEQWRSADAIALELLAHPPAGGDEHGVERADHFAGLINESVDELRAIDLSLTRDLEADHRAALLALERSRWLSAIAAGLSLVCMIGGVAVIVRIMLANIDRLVDGARRFARGDRQHRIDVQVPPELRQVADEFNTMIGLIHQSEEALAQQARRDALTELPNRRAFEEALTEAYARVRRLGEQVVLLTLDLDDFKTINDTHGHAAGDEVLRAIGRTMTRTIREVDKAFRTGGEEFAVLLVGTDIAGAKVAAERLRAAIASCPVAVGGTDIGVSASIGIAFVRPDQARDDLVQAADRALYAAKAGGRNRVVAAGD